MSNFCEKYKKLIIGFSVGICVIAAAIALALVCLDVLGTNEVYYIYS